MSFNTPTGTRGRRQPGKAMAWLNKLAIGRIRRTGKMTGMNALILTTIGRKSGVERHTPVGRFPGPSGSWLVVASAAGASGHPAWYYNLAANPDRAWVEMGQGKIPVKAEELHGAQREKAWQQITNESPRFASYQKVTDRQLPVIQLTKPAN